MLEKVTERYPLPSNIPLYLFVGRMNWYKGIQLILDALAMLKEAGKEFRAVFIGDGSDLSKIKEYSEAKRLCGLCYFLGAIREREALRAWYCRADLFLFPSSYDTNGLVVREAAACSLGSVLIRGSCAAEGVVDGRNGFLIEETARDLYQKLHSFSTFPSRYEQWERWQTVSSTYLGRMR